MTKRVLLPVADGFEEIETVTMIDVLRRAGVEVLCAGLTPGPLTGSRKVKLMPDVLFEEVCGQAFDMIVLPGGQPGVDNLRKNPKLLELLKQRDAQKKPIGAICAAPLILRDAGVLARKKVTSHPSVEAGLKESLYSQERIVMDGHLLTSRGPGTAMEFALAVTEFLCGTAKRQELEKAMLVGS